MSIRLDPRRVGTLKQLAAEADMRPGDLVRQWVEERIDAARGGASPAAPASDRVLGLIAAIEARLAALEAAAGTTAAPPAPEPARQAESRQGRTRAGARVEAAAAREAEAGERRPVRASTSPSTTR